MTRLHLPYAALSWMAAMVAMAGAAYLIFRAPFPRIIRYGFAASYWIVYQYAAIARPYVFAPLLVFAAADLFSRARERTYLFTAVLGLLAFTSAHGTVMAMVFALVYALRFVPDWKSLDPVARRRHVTAAAIFATALLLIAAELYPPRDLMIPSSGRNWERFYDSFNGALLDWFPASVLVALTFGFWTWRRKNLVAYSLGLGGLIVLYGLVHGWPHHYGMAFVMLIGVLWQSWPSGSELAGFGSIDRVAYFCAWGALDVVLGLQMFYSAVAIDHEYRLPYSGATQAAAYLKRIVDRGQVIYGFDYGMNSVLAYFDHNIFQNEAQLLDGASFFHHSNAYVVADRESFLSFRQRRPDYLLFICWRPPQAGEIRTLASDNGYVLERVFPGQVIAKSSFDVYQTYLLYRRCDLPGQSSPGWNERTNEVSLARE
jgi:hypothetical protein